MCEWLEWWTDDHKVIDSSLHSPDEHKDVETVVDWLFSVTPGQLLQPKQIQSFHELFCLNVLMPLSRDLVLVKQNKKILIKV